MRTPRRLEPRKKLRGFHENPKPSKPCSLLINTARGIDMGFKDLPLCELIKLEQYASYEFGTVKNCEPPKPKPQTLSASFETPAY